MAVDSVTNKLLGVSVNGVVTRYQFNKIFCINYQKIKQSPTHYADLYCSIKSSFD